MTIDKNETKTKILDAALRIFCTHGYARSSTRMICAEASVNIALIHYHFTDKETLYQTVIAVYSQEVYEQLKSLFESNIPTIDKLTQLYTHHLKSSLPDAKGSVWRLFLRESIEPSGALNADCFDKLAPIHNLMRKFISIETGLPYDDCHALVYVINGIPSAFKQISNFVKHLSPELYSSEAQLPELARRCAEYAMTLIQKERQ